MDGSGLFCQRGCTAFPTPYLLATPCNINLGKSHTVTQSITAFTPALFVSLFMGLPLAAQCVPADMRTTLSDAERLAVQQEVADIPYGVGRAFEATRGDASLFLFGTFHSEAAGDMPAALTSAIANADRVFVEVTAADNAAFQEQMQRDPSIIMDLDGPGLQQDLTEQDWAALSEALRPLGIQPQIADTLQPWFAATMVSIPLCEVQQQARGGQPIDAKIEVEATALGKPVLGLETVEETFAVFAGISREAQVDFLRLELSDTDTSGAIFMTLAKQYTEGRIAEIQALSNVLAARDIPMEQVNAMNDVLLEPLLNQRNRNWLPAIVDAGREGSAVIAVGALHLGGEDGLLRLLEGEGFDITRIELDGEVRE